MYQNKTKKDFFLKEGFIREALKKGKIAGNNIVRHNYSGNKLEVYQNITKKVFQKEEFWKDRKKLPEEGHNYNLEMYSVMYIQMYIRQNKKEFKTL